MTDRSPATAARAVRLVVPATGRLRGLLHAFVLVGREVGSGAVRALLLQRRLLAPPGMLMRWPSHLQRASCRAPYLACAGRTATSIRKLTGRSARARGVQRCSPSWPGCAFRSRESKPVPLSCAARSPLRCRHWPIPARQVCPTCHRCSRSGLMPSTRARLGCATRSRASGNALSNRHTEPGRHRRKTAAAPIARVCARGRPRQLWCRAHARHRVRRI